MPLHSNLGDRVRFQEREREREREEREERREGGKERGTVGGREGAKGYSLEKLTASQTRATNTKI